MSQSITNISRYSRTFRETLFIDFRVVGCLLMKLHTSFKWVLYSIEPRVSSTAVTSHLYSCCCTRRSPHTRHRISTQIGRSLQLWELARLSALDPLLDRTPLMGFPWSKKRLSCRSTSLPSSTTKVQGFFRWGWNNYKKLNNGYFRKDSLALPSSHKFYRGLFIVFGFTIEGDSKVLRKC